MSNRISLLSAGAIAALMITASFVGPSMARERTVMVGGAAMYPSKNIVQNAVHSKDHTTLVAAVKAAGLVEYPVRPRPLHCLRADQCRLCKAPQGNRRDVGQA